MATHADREVYRIVITDGLPSTSLWRRVTAVIKGLLTRDHYQILTRTDEDAINWR